MKVALSLSGQFKCFDKCGESQKKYLLDILNCDVFCHFWDTADLKPSSRPSFGFSNYINKIKINSQLSCLKKTNHNCYREYYDEETKNIIYKQFKWTINTFDYTF